MVHVSTGHGDMAVSNAVGSDVFDILLCLGLPWFMCQLVTVTWRCLTQWEAMYLTFYCVSVYRGSCVNRSRWHGGVYRSGKQCIWHSIVPWSTAVDVSTGHCNMAVSDAVGSNVFDILLCLGLPRLMCQQVTVTWRCLTQWEAMYLTFYCALVYCGSCVNRSRWHGGV